MEFKTYVKNGLTLLRVYVPGEDLSKVSVPNGHTPELGDFIAKDPNNENDLWLISKKYFEENYSPDAIEDIEVQVDEPSQKTLNNTTASQAKDNVSDIEFWGNGDTFKLISKASSKKEGWMKSTKAMQIDNVGCVVQVTTQQGGRIAEALTFVPGAKIKEETKDGKVVSRKLI